MSIHRFTDRQRLGWSDVVEALDAHGISTPASYISHHWHVDWSEETRPARGQFFNGVFCDGEHFVQVLMDVYGMPNISIATVDWIHADSDEENECETCEVP